jgi:hypothetical protein
MSNFLFRIQKTRAPSWVVGWGRRYGPVFARSPAGRRAWRVWPNWCRVGAVDTAWSSATGTSKSPPRMKRLSIWLSNK